MHRERMTDGEEAPFAFRPPIWLDETASTNSWLKARAAADPNLAVGTVVAARRQTGGRGRMDGVWLSAPEGDITFSFLWRGRRPPLAVGSLPMACALGVRDFLAGAPWTIATACKWPNDVLVGDAKICGILTEGTGVAPGPLTLIIGIGLNVRRLAGREACLGRATAAMEDVYPAVPPAETLLPLLLERLAVRITAWSHRGFAALRTDYEACLWGRGRTVAAKTAAGTVRGTVLGLGEDAELLLRTADGTVVPVASVSALEGWDAAGAGVGEGDAGVR
ncbi:MAG: biotin--[acetyl-CoA-carboxylase] ligase [Planctomycetes bacterium]|nr:biotin--[acetyl-CoA-carboxylase] ligase [Planctomycetota bacterium]